MRWKGRRASRNVEDRRGRGGAGRRTIGGGIGTIAIVLVAMYFGVDPSLILNQLSAPANTPSQSGQSAQPRSAAENELAEFTSVVLADTEDAWHAIFKNIGNTYSEPKLVLFTGSVRSACGSASAAVGPFYCPGDQQVYIDLSFYQTLRSQLGAPGDFAQAYVIAHEVGHHVQTLLGISKKVRDIKVGLDESGGNALSVRQELQADCFAGLWANRTQANKDVLERGDLEEALNAAGAIGDDQLQRQAGGTVRPDSFTHGTSAQRVHWFKRGWDSGNISQCDTFGAKKL